MQFHGLDAKDREILALLREDARMSYSDIGEVKKIRNLGDKSYSEIQTKVLLFGYKRLNDAKKTEFFLDLLNENITQ